MVENKRIKMKAGNKKKKRVIKQKQQQKQVVTQNVKVVVGTRPRAKSTAPRSTPAKQPNIISISMPQAQQPVYNPIASNYYEEEINRVRARQQAEYDSLLNNPLAQNIKIHQAKVERNENKLVKAGILPNLTAEPNDLSKMNDMLAVRIRQQQKHYEASTTPKPKISFVDELEAKFKSGLKSTSGRVTKTPEPRTASPYEHFIQKSMEKRRVAIEEADVWNTGVEESKVEVQLRNKLNDEENKILRKIEENDEGGAGARTPLDIWRGGGEEGLGTQADTNNRAGVRPKMKKVAPNQGKEIERLKNMDLTEYRTHMTSTGDKIYKVASALGINYTVDKKRMSVEALRPIIEDIVGRKAPVIHRGKEAKIPGKLIFG